MTSEFIKRKAEELGATICGIGRIYEEVFCQMQRQSSALVSQYQKVFIWQ